ncbi:hypothetical protein Tco_0321338 [Tanacetum coccineum]
MTVVGGGSDSEMIGKPKLIGGFSSELYDDHCGVLVYRKLMSFGRKRPGGRGNTSSPKSSESGPPHLLRLVVGGIVGRIVVVNYRVVVEKFEYIAFVVEVVIVEMQFVDRD